MPYTKCPLMNQYPGSMYMPQYCPLMMQNDITSGAGPDDWVGLDWMELRLLPR
jgi:hypothetical protein